MPKYRYIVISQDNRQHRGTIGSPDEESARRELNELGFSVVAIEKTEETAETTAAPGTEKSTQTTATPAEAGGVPTFEFSATDRNQKNVVGTIQAEDRFSAYKRLVQEYEFELQYVVKGDLPEKNKEEERQKGIFDLQTKLEEELSHLKKKESSDERDIREFEMLQGALSEQIEFVLKKVKEMLDQYEASMKPETKAKIKTYVEKILRIKNSTNLDYIQKTAEELLVYLQKKEIFLQENQHARERTKMLVEAKSMMMQLKRRAAQKKLSLTEKLRRWQEENVTDKNPGPLIKLANMVVQLIIGISNETPETINLKKDISIVENQIRQYLILFFQSKTPQFRAETKEGIKRLWGERRRLKKELKICRQKAVQEQRIKTGIPLSEHMTSELFPLSGWLLTFYLIYYFISLYMSTKQMGDANIPFIFTIFSTGFLKYFLITLFLFHGSLSIRKNFFPNNGTVALILYPSWILASIIIFLNL